MYSIKAKVESAFISIKKNNKYDLSKIDSKKYSQVVRMALTREKMLRNSLSYWKLIEINVKLIFKKDQNSLQSMNFWTFLTILYLIGIFEFYH